MYTLSRWQKIWLRFSLLYKRGTVAEATRLRLLNHALIQENKCPRFTDVQLLGIRQAMQRRANENTTPRPYMPCPQEVPHINATLLLTVPDSMYRLR